MLAADFVVVGQGHNSTPLAAARAASSSGVKVPSETTEWQCRSALRMEDTFAFYWVWNTDAGAWMLL